MTCWTCRASRPARSSWPPRRSTRRAVVAEVVDAWRDAAEAKGLSLFARFDVEVPEWVRADPLRIRQVLTNLVSNAIKFTARGHVRVSVSAEPSGPGPADPLRRVSDIAGPRRAARGRRSGVRQLHPQADETISRGYGGAGLGLAISPRSLARQLGGDLVLCAASGGGACFVPQQIPRADRLCARSRSRPRPGSRTRSWVRSGC
ncbi:sensor histidine kinase [Caulobacter segnis]